jgi:hypothetical protein
MPDDASGNGTEFAVPCDVTGYSANDRTFDTAFRLCGGRHADHPDERRTNDKCFHDQTLEVSIRLKVWSVFRSNRAPGSRWPSRLRRETAVGVLDPRSRSS